jgi:hypothetical protein
MVGTFLKGNPLLRMPEIPDRFADPLVNLYHQFEGAPGPDEMLGKRRSGQKSRRLSGNLGVKVISMARPAAGQLSLRFHPVVECWRPLVLVAAAFEEAQTFYRPKRRIQPAIAANRCNKRTNSLQKSTTGKLQGVQLDLFSAFYRPEAPVRPKPDPERPLADVFPEAYE